MTTANQCLRLALVEELIDAGLAPAEAHERAERQDLDALSEERRWELRYRYRSRGAARAREAIAAGLRDQAAEARRLLGEGLPVEKIARRLGLSRPTVALLLAGARAGTAEPPWTPQEDRLLGTLPDQDMATQSGRSAGAV